MDQAAIMLPKWFTLLPPEIAELSRRHNDANVLCLPGRFMDNDTARRCTELFLATEFEGGRHLDRIKKIDEQVIT